MRIPTLLAAALWGWAVAGACADEADPGLSRFLVDICLYPQETTNPSPYQRCSGTVAVAFHGGSEPLQGRFQKIGEYLNTVLQGQGVHYVFNQPQNVANLLVFLDPVDQVDEPFSRMARVMSDPGHALGFAYFHTAGRNVIHLRPSVDPHGKILGQLLYFNSAVYDGDAGDRMILRLLLSALGPDGRSKVYPRSVFASDYVRNGNGTTLDEFDQAALRFVMREVPPGAKEGDIVRMLAGRGAPLLAALPQASPVSSEATPPATPAATP